MINTPTHAAIPDMAAANVGHSDARWHPIRNHFGITAFGINAYVARRAGDRIIGEHDHADPEDEQHQELYFVHAGRARFDVDGTIIDAAAGTFVNVPNVTTRRSATAEEDGTVIIVIGAESGAPFAVTPAELEELSEVGIAANPA